jgi:hypothetical protein
MHRRPLGRGRLLVLLSAVVIVAGCLLPWYGLGGEGGLPATELRAFDGSGILTFVAALAAVALVALPYAAGDHPIAADRGLSYGLLLLLALTGVGIWPLDLLGEFIAGLSPARAPGYWIAVVGVAVLARAVYEIVQDPARA